MVTGHSLIVVVPGSAAACWPAPGRPGPVWDAGKRQSAGWVPPARLAAGEPLELRGVTESMTFLGWTVAPGYEGLLDCWPVRDGGPARGPGATGARGGGGGGAV